MIYTYRERVEARQLDTGEVLGAGRLEKDERRIKK